ncbi:MAG: nucleotidyltransferase family protein [Thermoguttaceae bacterium]
MSQSNMDKLVVLARGLGTRMRRADDSAAVDNTQAAVANTGIKALIPIASGRPFLDYVLSSVADAGYRQVCLVIGPEQEAIRSYYSGLDARRLSFSFACQEEPKGTADAVAAAESFSAGDPITVINSDNLYPAEALRALRQQPGFGVALFDRDAMLSGNVPEERIQRFAIAKIDGQNCLQQIIEKPDAAVLEAMEKPIWLSMNCWRFGPSIFEAARAIKPSSRGEFEIPDAVQYVINTLKEPFHVALVQSPVLDLTSRGDIARVEKLLDGMEIQL